MKSLPSVYALILNYNGRFLTLECVKSVLNSNYQNYRTIVVDNGSHDGSASILRQRFGSRVTIIQNNENLGYARGLMLVWSMLLIELMLSMLW